MREDKLLTLLRRMSRKELASFIDFCNSPYFNRDKRVCALISHLHQFHPHYPVDCLLLEKLPKTVFNSSGDVTKKQLSYVKSDVYRLLRDFIGYEDLKEDNYPLSISTARAMLQYDGSAGIAILEKVKATLDTQGGSGHEHVLRQYQVNDWLHSLKANQRGTGEALLQASIDKLEEFYLINKLSYGCEIENRARIMRSDFPFANPLMPTIEDALHQRRDLDSLTELYFRLYLTTKYENEETYFDQLVQLVKDTPPEEIDPQELRGIYLATINIGLRKMRAQPEKYRPICIELYESGITTKVLFENGQLSEWTYQNAIRLGLRAERYDWTEGFIQHFNNFLPSHAQSNALHSNLAELYFYKEDYDLSLDHLNQINTSHFKYYINTKILLIKVFYEKGEMEPCLHNLASLTVYLSRRKDVTKAHRKGYQHFCQVLYQITSSKSEKKVEKVKQKLQTIAPMAEQAWLLEVFQREHPRA